MAKIRVKRISQYAYRFRTIKLFANHTTLGSIENGKTEEFIIPSGNYQIYAKIDGLSTNILALTIGENETKILELGCKIQGWKLLLVLFYIIFNFGHNLYLKEIRE